MPQYQPTVTVKPSAVFADVEINDSIPGLLYILTLFSQRTNKSSSVTVTRYGSVTVSVNLLLKSVFDVLKNYY